jgi:hypothetical protein
MSEKAMGRRTVATRSVADGSSEASEASMMCRVGRAVALKVGGRGVIYCLPWNGGADDGRRRRSPVV